MALDDLRFNGAPVPEPDGVMLMLAGVAALGLRRAARGSRA